MTLKKLNFTEVELPSNQKFGFFFTVVFFVAAAYSYYINSEGLLYTLGTISLTFFAVTIVNADALFPLNKLWMKFGILLGMIVSPIVMGLIFFGLFTPIAMLMRLFGRDELRLRFNKKTSHWINRDATGQNGSFNNQF